MAEEMNLPAQKVRQSLMHLERDNILISREGRRMNEDLITKQKHDAKRFIYWQFHSDIVRVVRQRLKDLKSELNKLIENEEAVSFLCPICNHKYSQTDGLQYRICHYCPNSILVKNEEQAAEAKRKRDEGLVALRPLLDQLRDCKHINLPDSFFGIDYAKTNIRKVTPVFVPRNISMPSKIKVNLIGFETPQTNAEVVPQDNDLINYYYNLEFPRKKTKVETSAGTVTKQYVTIDGKRVEVGDVSADMEATMTSEEHRKFYEVFTANYNTL